ncbi:MAG: tetratricopeptide repeat protein [Candidatus Gastranaerophilales bacterium]|nr:tetratricopeptide repeat protein [Candidatus Gastranaerophilales bacterium]
MEKNTKHLPFIKNSISEFLTSSAVSSEDIRKFFPEDKIHDDFISCFINRKNYLNDIFDSLNSNEQNLILISGFQGTGKTTLIRSVEAVLEENVLCFYYKCSQITNQDDIILNFYRYLHRYFLKDPEFTRTYKSFGNQSIDERLINYLKSLKRPLLVVIDGFENILKDKSETIDRELNNFINYILATPFVKVIISGRKLPLELKTGRNNIMSHRLGGLGETDALMLLNNSNIDCSESTLYQLYEISRGYPESMKLFISAVKHLKLNAFDIIKDYTSSDDGFEDYIVKKIYDNIADSSRNLTWHLSIIRNYIDMAAIKNLHLSENPEDTAQYLQERMILTSNADEYYIKKSLKEYVYKTVPYSEKIKIHKYWHELYSEQISKKLEDRFFSISRKLLHSEQYYHYICLTKLDKNFSLDNNQKIQYMTDSHLVSLYKLKDSETTSDMPAVDNVRQTEASKEMHIQNTSPYNDVYVDADLTIELTEEEKLLLNDESTDKKSDSEELYTVLEPDISTEQELKSTNIEDFRDYYLNMANGPISSDKVDFVLTNLKKAYEVSENIDDTASLANISFSIANVLREVNKLDDAIEYYNKAYQMFAGLNDNSNAVQTVLNIANIYSDCFKHDLALQYYHKILDNTDSKIPEKTHIEALMGVGEIYDYREDLDFALRFYKEAYEQAMKIADEEMKAVVCFKLALVHDDMKNFDKALEFYKRSNEICSNYEKNPNLSSSYANIAAIYEEIDDKSQAKEYYLKSLEIDTKMNSWEDQYKTLSRLGNLYFESGNITNAFDNFHRELAIAKKINDPYFIAMSFLDIGDLYFYLKNYEKAVKAFILARKTIGNTISTDSKEKIERRFRHVISEISEAKFNAILKSMTKQDLV